PGRYLLCTQNIPLKPGAYYEFSVWVKTQGIQGEDTGATVCVEFYDSEGKYIGGTYPAGIKGDRDWTQIKAISSRVPQNAARCNVTVYVRRNMTGTAWFDDVVVQRAFMDPLDAVLVRPNYRGILWPEQVPVVEIDAAVSMEDLADRELAAENTTLAAEVVAQDGRRVASDKASPAKPRQSLVVTLPKDLAPGDYTVSVRLLSGAAGELVSEKTWRLRRLAPGTPKPAVWVDQHNRLIVDGQPFFPLGCYFYAGHLTDEILKVFADSPFNCLMPYGLPTREQLDLCHKYGIKVIYSVKDLYAGTTWCPKEIKTPEDERPFMENIITRLRDHPALLAWYLNDELPLTFLPRLEAHQQWVEELDPDHPTWVVLYQHRDIRKYTRTFDAVGTDPYPVPGSHPSRAAEWTRDTVEGVCRARPVWQVPQIFNHAVYNQDAAARPPTYEEMRSMAWQCLCEGATGLVFYSFFDIRRDPATPFEVQWERVKKMAAEIKEWVPVLTSVEQPLQVTARGAHIHWMAKAREGVTYVFAVNDDYEGHSVAFQLPPGASGLKLLPSPVRQTAQVLEATSGRVSDKLPPLDMRVYTVLPGAQ
ncbi:MAG: hypothetical protein H5T86_08980, partial [Armatimonadetes bacterium]|nr:hypothetical protein [Armatimonadota bacterium]